MLSSNLKHEFSESRLKNEIVLCIFVAPSERWTLQKLLLIAEEKIMRNISIRNSRICRRSTVEATKYMKFMLKYVTIRPSKF